MTCFDYGLLGVGVLAGMLSDPCLILASYTQRSPDAHTLKQHRAARIGCPGFRVVIALLTYVDK